MLLAMLKASGFTLPQGDRTQIKESLDKAYLIWRAFQGLLLLETNITKPPRDDTLILNCLKLLGFSLVASYSNDYLKAKYRDLAKKFIETTSEANAQALRVHMATTRAFPVNESPQALPAVLTQLSATMLL